MNRNKLVALNGIVVLFTTVLNAVLGMVEISLLLDKYGTTINGLIQTGNQVLSYLVLIEAGISSAFLYKMYKPIAEKDNTALSSLYTGFRKCMSSTVNKMLIAAIVICALYPLIVNADLSYFYIVSVFVLLSFKTILPYKITMVPKYMLIVKEQKYKAELISGLCKTLTFIAEIILMLVADLPIHALLVATIIVSLISGIWFEFSMRKLFKNSLDKSANPNISPNKMSKDLLVHNISRMAFSSSSNIVISTMGTMNDVTIFSSYNMVVGQIAELSSKFLDGITASLGIKIANKDSNSYSIYRQMLSGCYWLGSIICCVFVTMINDLITIWIGEEYCVSLLNVFLFGIAMYCGILLPCIQSARNACGLYKESRNFTAFQAILNIIITLTLVPFLGVTGALLGIVIARICVTIPCNYSLVAKKVFPQHKAKWLELIVPVLFMGLLIMVLLPLKSYLDSVIPSDIIGFIIKAGIFTVICATTSTIFYLCINKSFRQFLTRIIGMFMKRKERS